MGKYMKKSKAAGDVAAVITEATLNSSSSHGVRTRARAAAAAALHKPSPPQIPDASYLQLRSRRLLKVPHPPPKPADKSRRCCESPTKTSSFSMSGSQDVDVGSFRDRSTRESTACSLIRDSNTNHTPGSTTKQRTRQRSIPTAYEMEEFFAYAEKQQQTTFIDKYNFDVVNDVPLPGRYEWVPVLN